MHRELLFVIAQDGCYVYVYKLFTTGERNVVTQPCQRLYRGQAVCSVYEPLQVISVEQLGGETRHFFKMSSNSMTTHFFLMNENQTWFNKYSRSVQKLRVDEEAGTKDPQPYICFKNPSGMLTVILLSSGQVFQFSLTPSLSETAEEPFRLSQNYNFFM